MRTLALLVVFAAGSVFSAVIPPSITITVTPTLGPDFGLSTASPNFDGWSTNVVTGLSTGTTPGAGVQTYVPLTNGTVLNGNEFIATPFQSWQGVTPGPFASEQGTALYFSLKVLALGGATFTLDSLGAQETYLGQLQLPYLPGDFGGGAGVFDGITTLGVRAGGGGFTDGTDTGSTLLSALYYVGVGFVQGLDPAAVGSDQDKINQTVLGVQSLADKTTTVCYSLSNSSIGQVEGCGNVGIADPPASGVPEPGTILLMGAGLAGVAFLRRRSA